MNSSLPVSHVAQILISIIPIVGIICSAIIVFFALLWRHRETVLKIKNGTYEPVNFNIKAFSLLTGLCLVGVGCVLTVLFILIEPVSWNLLGGLIPFVLGVMLLVFYKINPDFRK